MTGIADRARASVTRLGPGDCDDWLAFRARNFGADSRQVDPDWWRWQVANPQLDGELPEAWISRRQGSIVGSQGGIPFRLMEEGRTAVASWAIDLMVDPEWRLRGVGPALSSAQADAYELAASVGISDAAYRAYLRAGWRDLGGIPTYIRTNDVAWIVDQVGWRRGRALAGRLVASAALAVSRLGSALVARSTRTVLRRVDRFDDRVDEVWASAARSYPVLAVRDRGALGWRFDAAPAADRYLRYYLVQGDRVRGYLVGRRERWRERDVFAIVDYLASPAWMYPLLARATALPEARALTAIRCQTLSPGNDLAFLAAGFVRVDPDDGRRGLIRASSSALRFMVHERGADGREDPDRASRPAFDRRRWFVTAGDSDISPA